jgi:hypothetical protein
MKYVRDQTGRFPERPHYESKELDALFEGIITKFLKSRHGKIEFPVTTDDLTVLIERDAKDLDIYADLTGYGAGVEGVTEFRPGQSLQCGYPEALARPRTWKTAFVRRLPMNTAMSTCTVICSR